MKRARQAAIDAVRTAAVLTTGVQRELGGGAPGKKDKADKSPVTVADFGSQALVCRGLSEAFPDDPVVGEEEAADLSGAEQASFRADVVARVSAALARDASETEVLRWIDRGRGSAGRRFWTVDPVDGTKGFLRGDHYAIALALLEDGQPCLAALGCPHLAGPDGRPGALYVASRGEGTRLLPLHGDDDGVEVSVSAVQRNAEIRIVESFEPGHSDHGWSGRFAAAVGLAADPVRIDSQAKYAVVAGGGAELYLRRPTQRGYVEKIWDHAAGALVVAEAGGRVTDVRGAPLDFSRGRLLSNNLGVVASNATIHDRVLAALESLAD
ncbi:MAG: 3'(2'),5'-bisphosphate nucleotidase [Myxococcota bacterium]